jgi:hypothetical protein
MVLVVLDGMRPIKNVIRDIVTKEFVKNSKNIIK